MGASAGGKPCHIEVTSRFCAASLWRRVSAAMSVLIQLIVLLAAVSSSIGQESRRGVFGISGVVQYPDGKPSAGATVTGVTACDREPVHLVQTTKTSTDGSFHLQPFDSACTRIQLRASNIQELWLKTGLDVFYPRENGTAPIVEATATGSPAATVITLGERGGLASFRVWDKATERFISAGLYLERLPVPGAKFGSMQFATGGTVLPTRYSCPLANMSFPSRAMLVTVRTTLRHVLFTKL